MEITKEQIDDLNAVIRVVLAPEDYREPVMSKLKQYARSANIPGFRPGKVPVSLIKKKYGKGVMYEHLNQKLTESLNSYISEEELKLVGQPLPKTVEELDLDIDANQAYNFEYEIGLSPEFELSYDLKEAPVIYSVEVEDEFLDEEVENVRLRHGDMTNPEVSDEGDILYGKVSELDEEGNPSEEGFSKMVALNPKRIQSEDFIAQMPGRKIGDRFEVKVTDFLNDETEIRAFFEMDGKGEKVRELEDAELDQMKLVSYDFELKKVNRFGKAEINQELFDKVYGEGVIESEEAFTEKIKEELNAYLQGEAGKYYRRQVLDAMIDHNAVDFPQDFLRRYLMETQKEITEANVEDQLKSYIRSLRWTAIIDKMVEENPDIKVEQADLEAKSRQIVEERYLPMMPEATEEQIDGFVQYQLQDQKAREQIYYDLLDERVFDHIKEKMQPKEETIGSKAFVEKIKAAN